MLAMFVGRLQLQDPVIYVVPDLKNFILDKVWAEAEQMADAFHTTHPNPKKMHMKDREAAGLKFVESVVELFVRKGMAPQIHCLNGKTVLWPGWSYMRRPNQTTQWHTAHNAHTSHSQRLTHSIIH